MSFRGKYSDRLTDDIECSDTNPAESVRNQSDESCINAKIGIGTEDTYMPEQQIKRRKTRKELGMFEYMHFREKDVDISMIKEDREKELTTKEFLRHALHSKPVHFVVISLVIVDSLLILFELLIDLRVIHVSADNPTSAIFHGFSIAILSIFMIEIFLKLYADFRHFIKHKIEVFDALVVVISFSIDILLVFVAIGESGAAPALGLIILLRLWRVVRIINGIILTVKLQSDEKAYDLKMELELTQKHLNSCKEKITKQLEAIDELVDLLRQNGFEVSGDILKEIK